MCKCGDSVSVRVRVAADLSSTGRVKHKIVGIDRCISRVVKALVEAGFHTRGSCCGHGNYPGFISFDDQPFMLIVASANDETYGSENWRPKPVPIEKEKEK